MQTEDRKRLIYHDKLAGYEHKCTAKRAKELVKEIPGYMSIFDDIEPETIINIQSFNLDYWFVPTRYHQIYYTHFENGIKVGDEWWFEGDEIQDSQGRIGIITYKDTEWNVYFAGDEMLLDFNVELCEFFGGNSKRIGSIHT